MKPSSSDYFQKHLSSSLQEVENHPVFKSIQTIEQLHLFMEHHVFAVWDFMSLLKFLQHVLAPTEVPWMPRPHGNLVRLVNEIVLGEESDRLLTPDSQTPSYGSHFDLYLSAMKEVGANTAPVEAFLKLLSEEGLQKGLHAPFLPEASRVFMNDTFALLSKGKAHEVAAAFAYGRENVIPGMFQSLLNKLSIGKEQAPIFHYYLQRHIELDGDEHGPAAARLVLTLCENNESKIQEALTTAREALQSRHTLWSSLNTDLQLNGC